MGDSRRNFIKKLGISALAGLNLSELLPASLPHFAKSTSSKKNQMTVLFQGDSITDGNRSRNSDWNHIMGHGYAYIVASRLWYDYPAENLLFINRGVSGDGLPELNARWRQDALDLKPDVISILVGVNDIIAFIQDRNSKSIHQFEENYKKLLDQTKKALPNTKLILCEPFILPLGWVEGNPEIWRGEIEKQQDITRILAKEYDSLFVELQKPFTEACKKADARYWIWDGIHPMPAGHELIAREWIKEAAQVLDFIKA